MINKRLLPACILALIYSVCGSGCSSAPDEQELASVRKAAEQLADEYLRLVEQKNTQTALDAYERELHKAIKGSDFGFERQKDFFVISMPVDSYFNIKRQAATLLPEALLQLSPLVQQIKEESNLALLILGHQDAKQHKADPKLSGAQAQAVAAVFRLSGLERERLMFKGVGNDWPKGKNDSDRRVELLVTPKKLLHSVVKHYQKPLPGKAEKTKQLKKEDNRDAVDKKLVGGYAP